MRRTPYGESSLVIQALTREHGRVHALAKGAYRKTSSYYCVLDFFDELDLEWSAAKKSDLATLRGARIQVRRTELPQWPDSYQSAVQILELAELAAQPAQPNRELFDLVSGALEALRGTPENAPRVLVVFELHFLQNLGLAPALRRCASCGGEALALQDESKLRGERIAFSAGAGGRLCLDCARDARNSGRRVGTLPLALLENAARLAKSGLAAAETLDAKALTDVGQFAEKFMDYHLESRPKSRRHARSRR